MVVKRGERRRRRRTCLSCCSKDCIGAPEGRMAGAYEEAAAAVVWRQIEIRRGDGKVRGMFRGMGGGNCGDRSGFERAILRTWGAGCCALRVPVLGEARGG